MNSGRYLILGALFIAQSIYKSSAQGTQVSGLWTDDYQHAVTIDDINTGWFIQNKMIVNGGVINTHLPQIETISNDGTRYYGPFEELHVGNLSGTINHFQRNFTCVLPTESVVVQYFTAGCATQGHEGDNTEIWLNDNKNETNYSVALGFGVNGWNAYIGQSEIGYVLDDQSLQTQCHTLTHDDNYYWVQRHGHKWTDIQQNEHFKITIRVDADNDDLVMLYGITVECISDHNSNFTAHKKSKVNAGVIIGIVLSVIIVIAALTFTSYKCMQNRLRFEAQNAMEVVSDDNQHNDGISVRVTESEYDMSDINLEQVYESNNNQQTR